jgi:Tify domain binding domain
MNLTRPDSSTAPCLQDTARFIYKLGVLHIPGQSGSCPDEAGPSSSHKMSSHCQHKISVCCSCAGCLGRKFFSCSQWEEHVGSARHRPSEYIVLLDLMMTLEDFSSTVAADPIDKAPWKW